MKQILIIGDVFTRTYTFYEPSATNSSLPDTDAPIDWDGYAVKFCVVNRGTVTKYDAVLGVIAGHTEKCKVTVSLTTEETAALKVSSASKRDTSYLEFTSGSTVLTRAARSLTIRQQGDL